MPPRRLALLAFFALAVLLALHVWHYLPYLADDALVSLRYAKRWASGAGLTFTDGERVEGYTNLLWVLLTGTAGRLGFDYVLAARALGFAGVLLCVACAGLEPRGPGSSPLRLVVGGGLVVATAPFAIWAIGGLEQGLLAGLLALALRLLERAAHTPSARALWLSSAPLALISLLRADGLLLAIAALAGAACLPRPSVASLRRVALTAVPSLAVFLAQLGFRLAYYGEWWPNTAFVRVAFTPERLFAGLSYVGHGYSSVSMLVLLALAATLRAFRRGERGRLALPWAVVLGSTSYIVVIGGDAAPGFRQLVPALVPLCFLVADELCASWPELRPERALVLPLLGLAISLHAMLGLEVSQNRRAREELAAWDSRALGETLKTAFGGQRPLLAVDRAGALPFFSELPSIDMLGASDRHIARTRSDEFGRGDAGFELGDPGYVLERAPDLVVFGDASATQKPEFSSSRDLVRSKKFRARYEPVRIEGGLENRAPQEIWILLEGGKLGVQRAPDRIEVPGYLLTGVESDAASRLDASGRLVAQISGMMPGILPSVDVPAGRWKLVIEPPRHKLLFDLRCNDVSMQAVGGSETGDVFELDTPSSVAVALAPGGREEVVPVRSLRFERETSLSAARTCKEDGQPLRVPAARLALRKDESTRVGHPGNVIFLRDGISVELGRRERVLHLELSLSTNDGYAIELRRDGTTVWSGSAPPKRRGKSKRNLNELRVRRYAVSPPPGAGVYELFVQPEQGKYPCAIGHVELG